MGRETNTHHETWNDQDSYLNVISIETSQAENNKSLVLLYQNGGFQFTCTEVDKTLTEGKNDWSPTPRGVNLYLLK